MNGTFPPWQRAHIVIFLNVLTILYCLFYHCPRKWREIDSWEVNTCSYPVCMLRLIKCIICIIFCSWAEIYSSPAIFAKYVIAKQSNFATKHKEETETSKTVFPCRLWHICISVQLAPTLSTPADRSDFKPLSVYPMSTAHPSPWLASLSKKKTCQFPATPAVSANPLNT